MRTTVVLLSLLGVGVANAQEAYKCSVNGKVIIQDSPCKVVGPTGPAPNTAEERAAIEAGMSICRVEAPKLVKWRDPESIRVGAVVPGKVVLTEVDGRKIRSRYFSVLVNAKNGFGGYSGEKPLGCYASEDGARILKVSTLLMD